MNAAAVYEPPDTADRYLAGLGPNSSWRRSWRTWITPRANDAARRPPPDRQIPTPSAGSPWPCSHGRDWTSGRAAGSAPGVVILFLSRV